MTAALFIGHPGHELVVHGWLERLAPRVYVLTDGSGAVARSRVPSSREVVERAGASPGGVFGAMSDRDAYAAVLLGDPSPFVEVARTIADELVQHDVRTLVSDAVEGYNPVHDLTRILADAIAIHAEERTGRPVARFEIGLVDPPLERDPPAEASVLELDEAEWERKRAAARGYVELQVELEAMLATRGVEGLRREVLWSVEPRALPPRFGGSARYERFGRERVSRGAYGQVIEEAAHVLPLAGLIGHALSSGARGGSP